MTDPLAILTERFRAATWEALGPAAPKESPLDPAIRRSDRADFQANGAMMLAKALGRKPKDLAAAIVAELRADDLCASVEIAGPGFINVRMRDDALTRLLIVAGEDEAAFLERTSSPEKVVIFYPINPANGGVLQHFTIGGSGRDNGIVYHQGRLFVGQLFGGISVFDTSGALLGSAVHQNGAPFQQSEVGPSVFVGDELVILSSLGIGYYQIL